MAYSQDDMLDGWAAQSRKQKARIESLESELASLRTWDGLMELLSEHWPAETFSGSSGDPGPTIAALIRVIDGLQQDNASLRTAVEAADVMANEIHKLRFDEESIECRRQVFGAERTYRAARAAVGEEGK